MSDEDVFNESAGTLPVLSDEDECYSQESALDQSSDVAFRSSGSSLFIPTARKGRGPTSTPRKTRVPSVSVSNKHKCALCGACLKTPKGLEKHVINHKLQEKARRRPTVEQFVERCIIDGRTIVNNIVDAPSSTDLTGEDFSNFAKKIRECADSEMDNDYSEFVKACVMPVAKQLCSSTSKAVLPPSIRREVRYGLHSVLADESVRSARLEKLLRVSEADQPIAELFLAEFSRRLIDPAVAFLVKLMRDAADDEHVIATSTKSKDDFDTLFDQQTLHKVVGYTVKAVLVRARQFKNNPKWKSFQTVILDRFAHIGTMEARTGEKSFWTALLGRKAYTFVSEPVLDFMSEVAKVMCYVETPKGNISKTLVWQKVISSSFIMAKWGVLIGSDLSENDSIFLMRLLIHSLCGTFGRGILLRRTNKEAEEHHKERVTAVSLRGRISR